ncbi:PREDICTED: eukaryotic translation initiation factor 1b-like [Thamnophis sirtalis]|uniref:Eukaryotic translation initiation factor 1b-like n=1 Tax=Thamnophis sirtalis TaxID=35019 RepID=A0A6I9YEN0_9SAUR|nr:PREDICTED: eukaryotic translation initiation factor 1b-like [Thamnophis sirtalis]
MNVNPNKISIDPHMYQSRKPPIAKGKSGTLHDFSCKRPWEQKSLTLFAVAGRLVKAPLPGRLSSPPHSIEGHQEDPFADATKGDDLLPAGTEEYIHIRIQQRNGRKTLTTVQGIADDYDKKKLVKAFKKKFACNGTVIEHPEYGEVIQLQGDQRKNICQFLLEVGIVKEEQLKVHGF